MGWLQINLFVLKDIYSYNWCFGKFKKRADENMEKESGLVGSHCLDEVDHYTYNYVGAK